MSQHRSKKIVKKRKFLNPVLIIFLIAQCISSFVLYYTSITGKKESGSSRVGKMVFSIPIAVILISVAQNMIIFLGKNRISIFTRFLLQNFLFVCIFLIFACDQRTAEDNMPGGFGFGYYSSRAFILSFIILSFIIFLLIIITTKVSKKTRRIFYVVFLFVIFLIIIFLLYCFVDRKQIFNKGYYGSFDISESDCHVNSDMFLLTTLIPKFIIHILVLWSYWCRRDIKFTKILESNNNNNNNDLSFSFISKVEIECSPNKVIIEYYPMVNHQEFEDIKWYGKLYGGRSKLQETLHKNMIKKSLNHDFDEVEMIGNRRDKFILSYDGSKYETIVVKCFKDYKKTKLQKKNLVINPIKRIKNKNLLEASPKNPNIISILFDSIGRKGLERDLSKSLSYLQRIVSSSSTSLEAFEFYNLHSFDLFTIPTTLAAYTGFYGGKTYTRDIGPDHIPIWWYEMHFKKNKKRRIVVSSTDTCEEWSSWIGNSTYYPADYVHAESFCTYEYFEPKRRFMAFKGPYCPARKCLYQYEAPEIIFNYMKKIEKLYPGKSKFLSMHFQDAHEKTGQSLQYVDQYLLNYLKFLYKRGILSNSILIIWSDHGNHESLISMINEGGIKLKENTQVYNPALQIIFPSKLINKKNKRIIKTNQQRLITHYDLHKLLWNILGFNNNENIVVKEDQRNIYGIDLLNKIVPRDRNIEDAGIRDGTGLIGKCFKND